MIAIGKKVKLLPIEVIRDNIKKYGNNYNVKMVSHFGTEVTIDRIVAEGFLIAEDNHMWFWESRWVTPENKIVRNLPDWF